MDTPHEPRPESDIEKQARKQEEHRQNLEGLHKLLAESFPADATFKNPNDPDGVDEYGQLITLTVTEIMAICEPYIAGLKPHMAFGVFEQMYVQPEGDVSLKLGQQAVSRPE